MITLVWTHGASDDGVQSSHCLQCLLCKTRIMVFLMTTATPHSRALSALGHDARLSIFRLLVQAGESGLRVGDIGAHLDIAPSNLAHHL